VENMQVIRSSNFKIYGSKACRVYLINVTIGYISLPVQVLVTLYLMLLPYINLDSL
jgi:hypothetical protein